MLWLLLLPGAAAAGTLGKLQLRRVLREAYAWPLSSGTRERSWCDAAQETLSSYYEHRQVGGGSAV